METLLFGLANYAALGLFITSCYGLGYYFSKSWNNDIPQTLHFIITIAIGIGIQIVGLQCIGVVGVMRFPYIFLFVFVGLVCTLINWRKYINALAAIFLGLKKALSFNQEISWVFPSMAILVCIELLLRPLQVPLVFDELMYHLPHVKEWLNHGSISINPWLRYPYFPYNYNLLFALGLTLDNDVFPHLVHALAGWLILFSLFIIAKEYCNKIVAYIAFFMFAILNFNHFGSAMIDLALGMFIFLSVICLYFWFVKQRLAMLYAALFLFGVAAGIKYQALLFGPLILVVILFKERRLFVLCKLALIFLIPCAYWYVRNYTQTGNPVAPMFPNFFGLADWNASDMRHQIFDIQLHKDYPNFLLWPALGIALFGKRILKSPWLLASVIFGVYGGITWWFSSHYSRYLLPMLPVYCILSALCLQTSWDKLTQFAANRTVYSVYLTRLQQGFSWIFLLLLSIAVVRSVPANLSRIQTSNQERDKFLATQIRSYEIGIYLKQHPGIKIVHLDFSSDIYYLPLGTKGDAFGPARTTDFLGLSTSDLVLKIKSIQANAILLPGEEHRISQLKGLPLKSPSEEIKKDKDFDKYFKLAMKRPEAELYVLRELTD